jgi:hypothetical protein
MKHQFLQSATPSPTACVCMLVEGYGAMVAGLHILRDLADKMGERLEMQIVLSFSTLASKAPRALVEKGYITFLGTAAWPCSAISA